MLIPNELSTVATQVKENGIPREETVRTILRWFGAQRRGIMVVAKIRYALKAVGLETIPDFELAYVDSYVQLSPTTSPCSPTITTIVENIDAESISAESTDPNDVIPPISEDSLRDPVPRIGMLPSANRIPLSVARDNSVQKAVTLMLMNDYSQLPVMQGERTVQGMISWRSIGRARSLNKPCDFVRDCLDANVTVLSFDAPLFDAIQSIIEQEAVLVKRADGKITGLVTASDIALQFKDLSEAFLLVGEIENHLRILLNGRFTAQEFREVVDPGDENRKNNIIGVTSLTFGEYIRLLENPDNWGKLSVNLERAPVLERLNKVREIRNDVMHFHPDGVAEEDVSLLRETVHFMQQLTAVEH